MKGRKRNILGYCFIVISIFLSACGGGGDGIDGTGLDAPVMLSGTAATGKAIVNKKVFVKGKKGKKVETNTDSAGKFEVDVSELESPYLLQTEAQNSRNLYSIALQSGTVNIHQISDLVSRNFFATQSVDIDAAFSTNTAISISLTETKINAILDSIEKLFLTAFQNFSVPTGFNFITSEFDANQTAFDLLLDQLRINYENEQFSVNIIDQRTSITANVVVNLNLNVDLTQTDTQDPTIPTAVSTIASSDSNIVTVWNSSTDDIGVSGYHIFRDGSDTQLTSVSVPVFNDTNLSPDTEYCYVVQAFDAEGNTSDKSGSFCTKTLTQADNTAPENITGVGTEIISNSQLKLRWTPSQENDVLGYHVYRQDGEEFTKISTVVTSSFDDEHLAVSEKFCYQVVAFDAALNASSENETFCGFTDIIPPVSAASVDGGTYDTDQSVVLSCNDEGSSGCANIYFTINGDEPTVNSPMYKDPINIHVATTLKFFAVDNAGQIEDVKQVVYNIVDPASDLIAPTSSANLSAGAYNTDQTVELSCTDDLTGCRAIYFTINGNQPTTSSLVYTTAIPVTTTMELKFFAVDNANNPEAIKSRIFTIDKVSPMTTPSVLEGIYNQAQSVSLSCDDENGSGCGPIYFTTNGDEPSTSSAVYSSAISITENTLLKYFSMDNAGNSESIESQNYVIDTLAPVTTISVLGGVYNQAKSVSLSCDDGAGSGCDEIYFTTNGDDPTVSSSKYGSAISVFENTELKYISVDLAGNSESVQSQDYVIDTIAPETSATPLGGTYNVAQNVTLSCDDGEGSGCASIHYTTNGDEPTTESAIYTSEINISETTELRFFAVDNAGNNSGLESELYTINIKPLTVDVSVLSNPVISNDWVLFHVSVGNTSGQSMDNVKVSLTLPAELSFNEARDAEPNALSCGTIGCNPSETPNWELGSLAIGESRTITINAFVAKSLADNIIITAPFTVSATGVDDVNVDKIVEVYSDRSVDLVVGASADPVKPGETFTITFDAGNAGIGALTNLQLSTVLPLGVTVVDISDDGSEVNPGEIEWNVASLLLGESLRREVRVTADNGLLSGAVLPINAQLTHDGGLAVDNRSEFAVTVVPSALPLSLDISTSANPVIDKTRALYTLTLSNTSQLPVDDINVQLRVPVELSFNEKRDAEPNALNCGTIGCNPTEEAVWDVGSLASGESRTISFSAYAGLLNTVLASGNLVTLPLRVTAANQLDTINLLKTVAVDNNTSADLVLGASADPVTPGETFAYTIDVGNVSSSFLANLQIRTVLPTGVTVEEISDAGSQAVNGEIIWDVPVLNAGGSLHREIVITADNGLSGGEILRANTKLIYDNGLQVDNQSEFAVTVVPSTLPLSLDFSTSANPIVEKTRALYTLTLSNTSLLPVDDVNVQLRMPAELSFNDKQDAEPNALNCGTIGCNPTEEANWDVGNLASGESRTISFNAYASLLNTVLASGNLVTLPLRITAANQMDTINLLKTVAVDNDTGVDMIAGATADPVTPDETFSYTIDVGNVSGSFLSNLQLTTILPAGVTVDSISDGGNEVSTGVIVWDITVLNAGASLHREVTVTADSGLSDGEILSAKTKLTYDDGLEMDNQSEFAVTVVPTALPLNVDISSSANPVVDDERTLYTFTVSNTSGLPVDGINLQLRVPAELSFDDKKDAEPDALNCGTIGCNLTEEANWDVGSLASGESHSITINAITDVNGSIVQSGNLITLPVRVTAANQDDVINRLKTVAVNNTASVEMAMSATDATNISVDPVVSGQTFTFTVDVGNVSGEGLTSLQLKTFLPVGVSVDTISDSGSEVSPGVVQWDVNSLAQDDNLQRSVTVTVDADLNGGVILRAKSQLTHDNGVEIDGMTEFAVTVVDEVSALTMKVETSANSVNAGNVLTYTITVTNSSVFPADMVNVLFRVPTQLNFHDETAAEPDALNCGTIGCNTREEALFDLGTIAANGASKVITIDATVAANSNSGSLIVVPMEVTSTAISDAINTLHVIPVVNP